jgi:drug/metabolite transporter (DMT)-like permease
MILTVRFAIASVVFTPWLRRLNRRLVCAGMLLGCLYFAECSSALIGLQTISANRSAFIVSLNVILVPLLSILLGQRLTVKIFGAAGIAIVGIGLLSWEGGGLNSGDFLTLGCAIGVAVYILTLGWLTPYYETLPLVGVQLWVMTLLSMGLAIPQLVTMPTEVGLAITTHFPTLLYLGLVVTATPIWTQAIAQRWIPAHEVALLYALEPVFATIFSFWLLGEQLGVQGFMGAGLVLFGVKAKGKTALYSFLTRWF